MRVGACRALSHVPTEADAGPASTSGNGSSSSSSSSGSGLPEALRDALPGAVLEDAGRVGKWAGGERAGCGGTPTQWVQVWGYPRPTC
jgi:hypothetical protein